MNKATKKLTAWHYLQSGFVGVEAAKLILVQSVHIY